MSDRFRFYLSQELKRRQVGNPRYSMRAFAKSLSLTHAAVSMYLSGKRSPSLDTQKLLEKNIRIPNQGNEINSLGLDADGFQAIDLQHYELISDWVHFAILSFLETKGAKLDVKLIAQKLSLPNVHVQECIQRLIDLKILKKTKNGRWRQSTPSLKVDNHISLHATKTMHTKLLSKSIEALDTSQFDERVYSGVCMAIDPKLIPFAKKKIQSYQRSLMKELESKGNKKQVYYLTLQMFPVTGDKK